MVKNPPANAGDMRPGFNLWIRKNLWKRKWQPTLVLLPGVPHGQRGLAGGPWGVARVGHDLATKPLPPFGNRE